MTQENSKTDCQGSLSLIEDQIGEGSRSISSDNAIIVRAFEKKEFKFWFDQESIFLKIWKFSCNNIMSAVYEMKSKSYEKKIPSNKVIKVETV